MHKPLLAVMFCCAASLTLTPGYLGSFLGEGGGSPAPLCLRQVPGMIRIWPEGVRTRTGQRHVFSASCDEQGDFQVVWRVEGGPSGASINSEGVFVASKAGTYPTR